ncbi:MAG: TetR/AcrR family transcriptional regulator [Carnobacterium sp.]|uniref:TetR/AcrR family transcriptional regulator n=1 Tax=Carnobacterium sp. TaxID=48221 RepID=UPI002FCA6704
MELERSTDKRILKSKKAISDAFIALLKETEEDEGFKKITITDIVRKADVNRGTFYKHFYFKEDILKETQADILSEFSLMLTENYQGVRFSSLKDTPLNDSIFKFILENKDFFHLAFQSIGFSNFQMDFTKCIEDVLTNQFFLHAAPSHISKSLFCTYIAHGLYGVLANWDNNDYQEPTLYMAQQITSILIFGHTDLDFSTEDNGSSTIEIII